MDGKEALNYILDNNIEGDIIECGVLSGNYEVIWIAELQRRKQKRHIYLYDTFKGLTKPTENDYTLDTAFFTRTAEVIKKEWDDNIIDETTNKLCYCPLENVKKRLNSTKYDQNYLHYVVGDVMETLKDKSTIPKKIAILRLDTDWYESSKYELEQMYDNVVDGGLIIFDDYFFWAGQRKATDEFFESRNLKYDVVQIPNITAGYSPQVGAIIKKKSA
jgi:O-methyltransferase